MKLLIINPLYGFVAALRHLNKSNGGAAVCRGGGSIAVTAQARVALSVGRNPNRQEERLLAVVKVNLAAKLAAVGLVPARGMAVTLGAFAATWLADKRAAGFKPDSLRASCESDLAQSFPLAVVTK